MFDVDKKKVTAAFKETHELKTNKSKFGSRLVMFAFIVMITNAICDRKPKTTITQRKVYRLGFLSLFEQSGRR